MSSQFRQHFIAKPVRFSLLRPKTRKELAAASVFCVVFVIPFAWLLVEQLAK